jgi:malonate-semialdehyde dehydrogenase (acetylating)/methylmalonate-semialdehyde dehydrogenase
MMLKYQALLRDNIEDISRICSEEHGKSLIMAKGGALRGVECVDHAAGLTSLMMGETLENVGRGVDIYSHRKPLGVVAGIAPFNFPAMIPLWMYPIAVTLGNTFVLKPSEKTPATMEILLDLLALSGVPNGVVNLVQGGRDTVKHICTHPDIKAITFMGGNQAGEYIYRTASQTGKRAQINMGAKNHTVVLPDADREYAVQSVLNGAYKCSGQVCMAISVAVMVGDAQKWIPDLVEASRKMKVGPGFTDPDIGPLNGKAQLEKAK